MFPTAGPAGFAAEYAAMAQVYQSDLEKIGVHAELRPTEFGTLLQTANALTYKGVMMLGGTYANYFESSSVYGFGTSFGYSKNFMGFSHPDYGPLVNAAANEPDQAKRKALYSKLNDFILDQSFNMPTSLYPSMAILNARVKGVLQRPGLMYVNAWLE
jgi:ABC-type transport system substrate-binding protein